MPTQGQEKSAHDEWYSTAHLFPNGEAPDYTTGIADSWRHHVWANRNPGPPLTREYDTKDWNNHSIKAQEFAHLRCEWSDGRPHWFGSNGGVP